MGPPLLAAAGEEVTALRADAVGEPFLHGACVGRQAAAGLPQAQEETGTRSRP